MCTWNKRSFESTSLLLGFFPSSYQLTDWLLAVVNQYFPDRDYSTALTEIKGFKTNKTVLYNLGFELQYTMYALVHLILNRYFLTSHVSLINKLRAGVHMYTCTTMYTHIYACTQTLRLQISCQKQINDYIPLLRTNISGIVHSFPSSISVMLIKIRKINWNCNRLSCDLIQRYNCIFSCPCNCFIFFSLKNSNRLRIPCSLFQLLKGTP